MPTFKGGSVIRGHPYVEVVVSADGQKGEKYTALLDTGFSGFVSVPLMTASLLGLKSHTTTRYELANGKLTDPVPLATGYAALEGDPFVEGLISISEHTDFVVGVDFLVRCGKVVMVSSKGVVLVNEAELLAELQAEQKALDDAANAAAKGST